MNTQEIIDKLTKADRSVIRDALGGVYSRVYVNAMFANIRRRTRLFRKVVRIYWKNRSSFADGVDRLFGEPMREDMMEGIEEPINKQ